MALVYVRVGNEIVFTVISILILWLPSLFLKPTDNKTRS